MNGSSTIDPGEAAHFGRLAADWWDPRGSSAMLHRLNPARLSYIRAQANRHWGLDAKERRPLAGRRAADVGCGAGLLAEPLARLGAKVTGVDPAPENILAARIHAEGQGLAIDYRAGSVEALSGPYDLITCLEVIEHVNGPGSFLQALSSELAETGLLILSTPNRTALSRFALIGLAEGIGQIPRGTHHHAKFLTPDELCALVAGVGLRVRDVRGLAFSPTRGFKLSEDKSLDYFVTATRP